MDVFKLMDLLLAATPIATRVNVAPEFFGDGVRVRYDLLVDPPYRLYVPLEREMSEDAIAERVQTRVLAALEALKDECTVDGENMDV